MGVIDLLIMKKARKGRIRDVRVYRQPECASNHHMLISHLIYVRRIMQERKEEDIEITKNEETIFKTDLLKQYSIKALYQNRIEPKLDVTREGTPEEMYCHLKEALFDAAREALGVEDRKTKYIENFSEEAEDLIKEKKKAYMKWLSEKTQESRKTYVELRREVKAKVREEKNEHWDRLCRDIDNTIGYSKATAAWKIIKKIRSNTRNKGIMQIIPPEQWVSHYTDLLQETRPQYLRNETILTGKYNRNT